MWFALILGQVAFGVVIAAIILPSHPPVRPQPVMVLVNLLMLVTEVPVMFVVRMMIFRRGMVDGRIRPAAFARGNMVFWAGCEAVSFFGLIIVILTGSWWPTIAIVAVALGLQAITFPVGGRLDGAEDLAAR
jgi:hypothetical protein